MFGSRAIEKNRKPSKFRDNKEKSEKPVKRQKPIRDHRQKEYDSQDYQPGC